MLTDTGYTGLTVFILLCLGSSYGTVHEEHDAHLTGLLVPHWELPLQTKGLALFGLGHSLYSISYILCLC
eukprot:g7041.t1